jgi:hypothetical protein
VYAILATPKDLPAQATATVSSSEASFKATFHCIVTSGLGSLHARILGLSVRPMGEAWGQGRKQGSATAGRPSRRICGQVNGCSHQRRTLNECRMGRGLEGNGARAITCYAVGDFRPVRQRQYCTSRPRNTAASPPWRHIFQGWPWPV